jgi:hypothetical protein
MGTREAADGDWVADGDEFRARRTLGFPARAAHRVRAGAIDEALTSRALESAARRPRRPAARASRSASTVPAAFCLAARCR